MMPNNLVLEVCHCNWFLVLVRLFRYRIDNGICLKYEAIVCHRVHFYRQEFGVKTVLASLMLPMYLRIFEILTRSVESLSGNIVIDLVCFDDRGWYGQRWSYLII